jgi:replicative DNA helicase
MQTKSNHWLEAGIGKLPPFSIESEEIVLTSILVINSIFELAGELSATQFYKESHQRIYNAAYTLYAKNEPVDMSTVAMQLRKAGELELIGGAGYLAQLTELALGNFRYHATIIKEMHYKRECITMGGKIMQMAYDDTVDAFTVMSYADSAVMNNNLLATNKKKPLTFSQQILQTLKEHQTHEKTGGKGISPGIPSMGKHFRYVEGELIVIAGRPGMGKTSVMVNDSISLAYAGVPVAIYELEMNFQAFIDRTLALITGIPLAEIKDGIYLRRPGDIKIVQDKASKLMELPLQVNDNPKWNVLEITADLRRLVKMYGIKVAYIDYLQLMELIENKSGNSLKSDQIGFITRTLKLTAKELGITIILFSQLSRKCEERPGDKRPMLSDLRDSGAIEQDADGVLFLYRPEYYNFKHDNEGNETIGLLEIMIAKFREGKPGTIKVRFNAEFSEITEWSSFPHQSDLQAEIPF